MNIPYEQLEPKAALKVYCDWIMSQLSKFQNPPFEWYFLFYPLRTLLMGARILNCKEYAEATWPFLDHYVEEQLPNGALTSNFRGQPAATMTQKDIEDLLRNGKLNLADNGSNVHGLLQAAVTMTDDEHRERYLGAAKKWLDGWVPIWALPNGSYGNGIWCGHKLNGPYSMAMNVCSAFAAYSIITGDDHYIENAEGFAMFQCDHWHPCGAPIRYNLYPLPSNDTLCGDYSRIFYLMEGLVWTHYATKKQEVKDRIAGRLTEWFEKELINRWPEDRGWFNMNRASIKYKGSELTDPATGITYTCSSEDARFYWQSSKCCAIPHLYSYYLNHIDDRADMRSMFERGGMYLSNPLKARMLGVMADDVVPDFCMQATGFAGLTVAEAADPDSCFKAYTEGTKA